MAVTPKVMPARREKTADQILPGDVILGRVLLDEHGEDYVRPYKHTRPVKTIEECAGAWRTHVHIDGGCWDGRTRLAVA